MLEIVRQANSVLLIDHHKTAQAELEDLMESGEIKGVIDLDKSGSMLCWQWFHPGVEPPRLIRHIQDMDLWRFEMEGTREVLAALSSYPFEMELWNQFMSSDLGELYAEGKAIYRAQMKQIAELIKTATLRQVIAGYEVPVLNAPGFYASEAGNLLAEGEAFAVIYQDTPSGRKFSLRSKATGVDVSKVAVRFGGGGHKHAAGFALAFEELGRLAKG